MKCSQIQPVGPGPQVERNIKIIALTKVHLKKKQDTNGHKVGYIF